MRTEKSNRTMSEIQLTYKPVKLGQITSSDQAYEHIMCVWDKNLINIQEQFGAIFLNSQKEILGYRVLHTGHTNKVSVDVKLLMSIACKMLAQSIILIHNHPCGSREITIGDFGMTRYIQHVSSLFEIDVVDHIIINPSGYTSFIDQGYMHPLPVAS